MRGRWLSGMVAVLGLLASMQPASAQYVTRYSAVTRGALTFTGNTVGFDSWVNNPSRGGFVSWMHSLQPQTNPTTFPFDTYGYVTSNWQQNGSRAKLTFNRRSGADGSTLTPYTSGVTVLSAWLIWSGFHTKTGNTDTGGVSSSINTPVTFGRPNGQKSPVSAVARTVRATRGRYYVSAADVTQMVREAGPGDYTVEGIPMLRNVTYDSGAGWTLAVAWSHPNEPFRNLTMWTGNQVVVAGTTIDVDTATVSGFCTPATGTVRARVLVSATEGDAYVDTGSPSSDGSSDTLSLGRPAGAGYTFTRLSGPRNLIGNFFAGQINDDAGVRDVSGDPNGPHHNPPGTTDGARQGWDVTNVDGTGVLGNSQTSAQVRIQTYNDQIIVNALGIQCDVGAPMPPTETLVVDKPLTSLGDTLTYTTTYTNMGGTAAAEQTTYTSQPALGLSFIPGSVTVNGVPTPGADPSVGVNVGTVAIGQTVTVTYQLRVDALPLEPAPARYDVEGEWSYDFLSCPGMPSNHSVGSAGVATTYVNRLVATKSADSAGAYLPGEPITYTIVVRNNGETPTSGTTLRDPLAPYLIYVPGQSTLNGSVISDGGTYPFTSPYLINSPGQAPGVLAVGATATITFRATVGPNPPTPIRNDAYIDPDGPSNPAPEIIASTENPRLSADLAVTKTDGKTVMDAGGTTTYTMTVTNVAGDTTTALTLQDQLPAALYDPVFTPSTGTYEPSTGVWSGLNLAAGQSITMTLEVKVRSTAQGSVTNTVTVHGAPGISNDPNLANNTASDTNTLERVADLKVTKSNGSSTLRPNSTTDYVVDVTNLGPSFVNELNLTDTLGAGLTLVSITPQRGVYTAATGLWTGVALAAGESVRLVVRATTSAATTGSVTNTVTVSAGSDYTDPDLSNNTASDTDTITTAGLYSIAGMVYDDANRNATRDPGETALGNYTMWVKVRNVGAPTAFGAVPVNTTDGTYTIPNLPNGTYEIFVDTNSDLTDVTPGLPAGWRFTGPPNGMRSETIAGANLVNRDFGAFHGSTLSGVVFVDNGQGGGIEGDGLQNGTEPPLPGVTVTAALSNGVAFATTTTGPDGTYSFVLPGVYAGAEIWITETNPAGYQSVSGHAGNTGGTYTLTTDTVAFQMAAGMDYTGVNFGDDQRPTMAGWVYHDLNLNATRDTGEMGLEIPGLWIKAIAEGATTAYAATPVDPTTGRWLDTIPAGTYTLILDDNDDLTDITPFKPDGWLGTENPNQTIGPISHTATDDDLNMGLYFGSTITGVVFVDDGAGGGVAANGIQDGAEAPLPDVSIEAWTDEGELIGTAVTGPDGRYTLIIPGDCCGFVTQIIETNPPGYISVSGHPGTTGGTYDLATDTTTFTLTSGLAYTDVNFGDLAAETVQGYVYNDANHDAARTLGEVGLGLAGWFVKMYEEGETTASAAYPVDPDTGLWSGPAVGTSVYFILDDNDNLNDLTPSRPAGWIGTEAPHRSAARWRCSRGSRTKTSVCGTARASAVGSSSITARAAARRRTGCGTGRKFRYRTCGSRRWWTE